MPAGKPKAAAPSLHDLQSRLQAAILEGDDGILAWIPSNSRTTHTTLFNVYRDGYRIRLREVLANDYPLLRRRVGQDEFHELASGFIDAHPSRTPNARWFGLEFPDYVASRGNTVRQKGFAELAAIERALSHAFDSADAAVLALPDLAQVPPDAWAELTFAPHPSVSQLIEETNAFRIWLALSEQTPPPRPAKHKQPQTVIAWRQDNRPLIRPMGYDEAMMWTEASKGVSFGGLCELLATYDPGNAPSRAAGYLHGWVTSGMLLSLAVQTERVGVTERSAGEPYSP